MEYDLLYLLRYMIKIIYYYKNITITRAQPTLNRTRSKMAFQIFFAGCSIFSPLWSLRVVYWSPYALYLALF